MFKLNAALMFIITQIRDTGSVDNVAELLMKGGVIMIPIILLSFISLYIFIERFTYIRRNAVIDKTLAGKIKVNLQSGKHAEAAAATAQTESSLGRILESGLSGQHADAKKAEGYMEATANIEIAEMEKHTGYLGIIAGIAPMLGFIGTISGVIKIFYNISLADNISIGIIAGGLYQKMICSGAGLIVGVIAYTFYHYLQMMIDRFSINMHREVNEVIKSL